MKKGKKDVGDQRKNGKRDGEGVNLRSGLRLKGNRIYDNIDSSFPIFFVESIINVLNSFYNLFELLSLHPLF